MHLKTTLAGKQAPYLTGSEKSFGKQPKEAVMKYGKLTLGQIEAIVNKLGGEDGVKRLLSGELAVTAAKQQKVKVWKTLKLGTGLKTADDFRKALKANGFNISDWANDLLGKPAFTAAAAETEVKLVKATVKELTGKDQAPYWEICQRAEERGWKKCPAEVGPQLRLQYPDQQYGEWLIIAMEPISASVGDLELFCVEHDDGGRWLYSFYGNADGVWSGGGQFVFCK